MTNVFERRSVNFFDREKDIDYALLKDIIDLASTAPSAFNLQPWDIIAVRSAEGKEKLHSLSSQQPKVLEAPVTLIILGNRKGYDVNNPQWAPLGQAVGEDNLPGYQNMAKSLYGSTEEREIKFAESNAGLLSMSIMYAAKQLGVDSHPMSGIDFEGIKKEFNIDEDKEVVMTISLGFLDEAKDLYPRSPRRAYDELVVTV